MAKVVVHVDDVDKVETAFSNVHNLITTLPTSEIVIVVNGAAVTTLVDVMWTEFMQDNPQVEVDACHNALVSHQVEVADLVAGVRVVPAGVVRIVELEELGFRYLKP
ncbi:hypothetical protein ACFP3T_05275 [Lactiplantibacillus dongliensis]|uniref:Sulfur reduction protein DsrE n=1 Tax=Lactiplantibacillus dongliensis TaxID=2559919 RepID=A0ABW1R4H7_9LACO|nr:hypothetical protein [Lactiplantibacillus dongliensis]